MFEVPQSLFAPAEWLSAVLALTTDPNFQVPSWFIFFATLGSLFFFTSDDEGQEYFFVASLLRKIFLIGPYILFAVLTQLFVVTASTLDPAYKTTGGAPLRFLFGIGAGCALSLMSILMVHWIAKGPKKNWFADAWIVPVLTISQSLVTLGLPIFSSIFFLLSLLMSIYMVHMTLSVTWRPVIVTIEIIALAVFANIDFKPALRLGPAEEPATTQARKASRANANCEAIANLAASGRPDPAHANFVQALNGWRTRLPNDEGARPTIIVVTASGGGYRATFWTAAVVDEIARRSASDEMLRQFYRDLRLVTGASGGMVALAYLATMESSLSSTSGDPLSEIIRKDLNREPSNSPVGQLGERDVKRPAILTPDRRPILTPLDRELVSH